MSHSRFKPALFVATALSTAMAVPAFAQQGGQAGGTSQPVTSGISEIIVTARRREESLQKVPISITVFNQQQLSNANLTNAGALAYYTPSLNVNARFGDDATTFSIRGFVQDLRTTASVGVYFADVVAPRGSNSQVSGDGAGPGDFFDLENVQVLKGPQGTLQGRNTTGGAVLIVPKKPTDQFEGYVQAGAGNYDMWQTQGVINVPVNDRVRLRLGIDQQSRNGYLHNVSGIGPKDFGDVHYQSGRASLDVDLTDTLENYTIFTYSHSHNNSTFAKVIACNPNPGAFGGLLGFLCSQQDPTPGFWDVTQNMPNPKSTINEWRLINTSTWKMTDNVTVKNIFAYEHLKGDFNSPVFGTNYQAPLFGPGGGTVPFRFAASTQRGDGVGNTSSSTMVEELQFQGTSFDDKLTWQTGAYYERTRPDGEYGQGSPSNISCDFASLVTADPSTMRCNDWFGGLAAMPVGSVSRTFDRVDYTNKALYLQATYDLTDQWAVTGGIRYTWDKTVGYERRDVYRFDNDIVFGTLFPPMPFDTVPCGGPGFDSSLSCHAAPKNSIQRSQAPTWLIDFDYKPTDRNLIYFSYRRGYRQGSVNVASIPPIDVVGPEHVDTFELGTKNTFGGMFPGHFNADIFYNKFKDMQLQAGFLAPQIFGGYGTTALFNAGKSRIWGIESDGDLTLFDDPDFGKFNVNYSYTYLNTQLLESKSQQVADAIMAAAGTVGSLSAVAGDELPYSPKHSLTFGANYTLPVPEQVGEVNVGVNYIYTGKQRAVESTNGSPFAVIPSYDLLNFNLNWTHIGGSPVDLSVFATNVLQEKYWIYVTGNFATLENETATLGHPRMFGARLRYNFGAYAD